MRQLLVLAVLITAWNSAVHAQSVPDPEFSLRPYAAGGDSTLQNLERAQAQVGTRNGWGGTNVHYTVFTPSSEVRFSRNDLPKFIIQSERGIDPAELILLCKGETTSTRRRFLHISIKPYGQARDVSSAYVKLEFKRIRGEIFEIIVPDNLPPGEYAFMPFSGGTGQPLTKIMLSCFGID